MKEYKIRINGNEYNVAINGIQNSVADVTVNGVSYSVELENGGAEGVPPANRATLGTVRGGTVNEVNGGVERSETFVGGTPSAPAKSSDATAAPAATSGKAVKSPLPGVIIEVSVKEGDSVKRGQKIAVLEAMKMENDILAPQDGTVAKVCVNKGDSVLEGAVIAQIS